MSDRAHKPGWMNGTRLVKNELCVYGNENAWNTNLSWAGV